MSTFQVTHTVLLEMGLATIWVIFSQTHLVTLGPDEIRLYFSSIGTKTMLTKS
jgi:hypothetical protein